MIQSEFYSKAAGESDEMGDDAKRHGVPLQGDDVAAAPVATVLPDWNAAMEKKAS